jgi:hypothetical protein
MSNPIVYSPWRSSDVVTSWPLPVIERPTSAPQIMPAAVMPIGWSPMPPRWNGGLPPGGVSRLASPDRAQ